MSGEIAFDGNRVGHRTQRVFHATWCEMNRHMVSLTPTTAAELRQPVDGLDSAAYPELARRARAGKVRLGDAITSASTRA